MTSLAQEVERLITLGNALHWSILNNFAIQLASGRSLSDKQLSVVAKAEALLASRKAEKEALANVPTPEGRVEVSFRIVKMKESSFRFHGGSAGVTDSVKVVGVMANGVKVWGTLPESLTLDAKEGDLVTLTATFTKKDAGFCTFSRPAKATLVSA
jgi:hypothetical protein